VLLLEGSIFENKQLLLLICAWFVLSFLILWFIGGACTNPVKGTECLASGSLDSLRNIPLIGLFLPYDQWNSLMYFFAPIVGFIFAFIMIRWWNSYFETTEASGIFFLIIIVAVLLIGYYVNLSFYTGEAATLNSRGQVKYSLYFCFSENSYGECYLNVQKINNEYMTIAQSAGANTVDQYIPVSYWAELRKSMFLVFVLGAIAGWLPLFALQVYKKYKQD
jgi:hypothetical protein